MKDWLTGRRRVAVLAGIAVLAAVGLGVVWGVADADRIEASAVASTTVPEGIAASSSTSSTFATTTTLVPTTSASSSLTTTTTERPPSSSGGGSGGSSSPPNQPPVIEDPGITSDGMKLTITPVITDPENQPVEIFFELDGNRLIVPKGAESATTTVDRGSDYVVGVSITIGVTDSAGGEVVETFDHELQAVTTVTVRDVRFAVGAGGCFAEEVAQRIVANLQFDGVVNEVSNHSEELRSDRSEVTLIDEITGEVVGEAPTQNLMIRALLNGQNDSFEGSHRKSDQVLSNLFRGDICRGTLTYKIEMETG